IFATTAASPQCKHLILLLINLASALQSLSGRLHNNKEIPMAKPILVLLAALWLSGCIIVIADDDVSRPDLDRETRSLTLTAADLTGLVATTGAGRFELIGEPGREEVEI